MIGSVSSAALIRALDCFLLREDAKARSGKLMDSNEELKPVTVMLSSHKLRKLEEIARLRNTTAPELAQSIIQVWLLKEYPPRTREEYEREAKDGWVDLRRIWEQIFKQIWRNIVYALKRLIAAR